MKETTVVAKREQPAFKRSLSLALAAALLFNVQAAGSYKVKLHAYINGRVDDKAVLVLDRPDAIGGDAVEGPILEEGLRGSFIGYFGLPTRHGMTLGELARAGAERGRAERDCEFHP